MAPARGNAAESRQTAQPPAAVARRVGPRVRQRGREFAPLYGPAAAQTGKGPGAAALADHRAGHGLPLPAARPRRAGRAGDRRGITSGHVSAALREMSYFLL